MILLFAGDDFYPLGGINDYVLTAQSLEDAENAFWHRVKTNSGFRPNWVHFADVNGKILKEKKMNDDDYDKWDYPFVEIDT